MDFQEFPIAVKPADVQILCKRACNATVNGWIQESPFIPETDDDKWPWSKAMASKWFVLRKAMPIWVDLITGSPEVCSAWYHRCAQSYLVGNEAVRLRLAAEMSGPRGLGAFPLQSPPRMPKQSCIEPCSETPNLQRHCLSLHLRKFVNMLVWDPRENCVCGQNPTSCMPLCNVLISYGCHPLDWYVSIPINSTYAAEGIQ